MERRERWLGYVAVGLGALALLAALNGRSASYITVAVPSAVTAPRVAPAPTVPPLMPAQPLIPEPPVPPRFFGHEHSEGPRFEHHFEHFWGRGTASGWGWPFGGLFEGGRRVADTLLRFAVAFFLLMLGLRLLRGRRGGNPPTGNGNGGEAPPTPMGGPPQPSAPASGPPHFGETTYL